MQALRFVVHGAVAAGLVAALAVMGGSLGYGLTSVPAQTQALAATVLLLAVANGIFLRVDWRALQGHATTKALARGGMMGWIGTVSVLLLVLAVLLVVVELLALLVFVGAWMPQGQAGATFAERFPLILAAVLLSNSLLLVLRQQVPPDAEDRAEGRRALAVVVLSSLGAVAVLAGVAWSTGTPQQAGLLAAIAPRQAVYIVSLGAVLEFLSVRLRLRLPSVTGMVRTAIGEVRRGDEQMRTETRQAAMRAYAGGLIFVALSMAAAGALISGRLGGSAGTTTLLPIIILYGVAAAGMLAWILIRTLQAQALGDRDRDEEDPLQGLVGKKPASPQEVARLAVYGITAFGALVCAILAALSFLERMPWSSTYGTDWTIGALLLGAGPYGWFFLQDARRASSLDERFPEFLRDIAESARAGMTLPRALVTAAGGDYGELNPDIQRMASQVEWGVPFSEAMEGFRQRTKTPLINRTVALVLQAERSGGNVVDSLTTASEDARAIQAITEERNAQMGLYNMVVYIAFFVFLGVVMVLLAQFLPAFAEAVAGTEGAQVSGGFQLKAFDQDLLIQLFFHAAIIQAIGGGIVGGVLSRGEPRLGIPHAAVMMVAGWIAFRVLWEVILA